MIKIKNHAISSIVTSTIMGHSGGGLFPLTLLPAYRRLREAIKQSDTTVIAKSSTYKKHLGNFRLWNPFSWKYIRCIGSDGLLNAYGLTNDGAEANARKIAATVKSGFRVIPSIYPQFAKGRDLAIEEVIQAITIFNLSRSKLARVVELNFSCPNSREKIRENIEDALACVRKIRQQFPVLILIGKISIVHPPEFVQELVKAGADIIHAVNTIPFNMVYPHRQSPLSAVGGGGVSGGPAFTHAYRYNKTLRRLISAPIIMGCGVMSRYNVDAYFRIGADAVSICTVCRLNPAEAIEIIKIFSH